MRNLKKAQASRPRSRERRAPGGRGEPPGRLGTGGNTGRPVEGGAENPLAKAMRSGMKSWRRQSHQANK